MRAFVTRAGGFIGRAVVRKLGERGDEVRALVRSAASADPLRALGAEVVEADLSDVASLTNALDGCDAAFHLAGVYRVGIPRAERPAMYAANVTGTRRATSRPGCATRSARQPEGRGRLSRRGGRRWP